MLTGSRCNTVAFLVGLLAACQNTTTAPVAPTAPQASNEAPATNSVNNGSNAAGVSGPAPAPVTPSVVPQLPAIAAAPQPVSATQAGTPAGQTTNALVNAITSIIANVAGSGGSSVQLPATVAPPAGSDITAWRQACVTAINQYRATIGRAALTEKTSAGTCIDGQAAADGAAGIAHSAFGKCGEYAQDECPSWPNPSETEQCLAQMWAEGPGGGHYDNMSNASYTQVECGFAQVGSSWWMTQDFFP